MREVRVSQHVFGSVDRDQSLMRRRGYQTLFYTQTGLSETEVQALEDRAQYYTSDAKPTKTQFFWLPTGKAVISQTVPLAELDEFGRKGRYLSHSLILTLEQWAESGCSPFDLLDVAPFFTSLAEAFGKGDAKTGDIPAISLEVPCVWEDKALALAQDWSPDELRLLARLSWGANAVVDRRQYVALIGSQEEILETLSVAFLLVPPFERKFCSFDTYSHGCDWTRQETFWGQGFATAEEASTSLVVDAGARQVWVPAFPWPSPTPYGRWVERVEIPDGLRSFLARQGWALILDALIRGKPIGWETFRTIDPTFAREFAELNASAVRAALAGTLPAGLSPRLSRALLAELDDSLLHLLGWLARGLTHGELARHLYTATLHYADHPLSEEECRALMDLADYHRGLGYLVHLWAQDVQGWRQSLREMSNREYRETTIPLLDRGIISAWQAIAPNHVSTWFDACVRYLRPGEITSIADGIAECGSECEVERLAEIVPHLIRSDQVALSAWVRSYRKPAPTLRAALEHASGKPDSRVDSLKRVVLGRPSKSDGSRVRRKGGRR